MRHLTLGLLLATLPTLCEAADPPRPKEPTFTFTRLKGVDAKAGVIHRSVGIATKLVTETRQRTITRVVNGNKVQEVVPYTVQVPVKLSVETVVSVESHDVYDGRGELVPADRVFERVGEGQLVLVVSLPALPEDYVKLLSPRATILVPKQAMKE